MVFRANLAEPKETVEAVVDVDPTPVLFPATSAIRGPTLFGLSTLLFKNPPLFRSPI
jgi:hypothetical protein